MFATYEKIWDDLEALGLTSRQAEGLLKQAMNYLKVNGHKLPETPVHVHVGVDPAPIVNEMAAPFEATQVAPPAPELEFIKFPDGALMTKIYFPA